MKERIIRTWQQKPLTIIIITGLILRLIAAFFAKGYGMHDDHFLVIEASQSWVDGTDYNNWLPQNQINPVPQGHSFFYVGLHYLLFSFFKLIGLSDPSFKMTIIRLLHAFFSMIVVILGYRITEKLSDKKTASIAGLLLASLWFMPFLGVRNLVEVVCIPFFFIGIWILMQAETRKHYLPQFLFAGLVMGIGFSVRFQTVIFIGGVGLALVILKKWKEALVFGFGALISMIAIQGIVDMFIWHRPFAELTEYIRYNIEHKNDYGTDNIWMYFELIPGILIPPVGVFIFIGFFMRWRKNLLFFLPCILFFAFHTIFPNKQERFILTIVPFIVIIGIIGWFEFANRSAYWQRHQKLQKNCFVFFWVINLIILPFLTTTFSKRARVETMIYLSKYKDIPSLLIEESTRTNPSMLPEYYLGQWPPIYMAGKTDSTCTDPTKLRKNDRIFKEVYTLEYFRYLDKEKQPQFILFLGNKELKSRVEKAKQIFPGVEFEAEINPGNIDRIMLKLNPNNQNQPIYIYKTNAQLMPAKL